jgi:hypothetical protein
MPTPTYTALATVTLGASASSVTFSSIPATYRDLILITSATISAAATSSGGFIRFNGDTGSNYTRVMMFAEGSIISNSATQTNLDMWAESETSPAIVRFDIMDYSATDKHKTALSRADRGGVRTVASANRWANTAAITSITISSPDSGSKTYIAGSTFNLYGVIA